MTNDIGSLGGVGKNSPKFILIKTFWLGWRPMNVGAAENRWSEDGMQWSGPVLFSTMNANAQTLTPGARLEALLLGAAVGDALGVTSEGTPAGFVSGEALNGYASIFGRGDGPGYGTSLTEYCTRVVAALDAAPHSAAVFATELGTNSQSASLVVGSAIVGAHLADDSAKRRAFVSAMARRGKHPIRFAQATGFISEVVAQCFRSANQAEVRGVVQASLSELTDTDLRWSVERAIVLAEEKTPIELAAAQLGTSARLPELLGLATFCLLRYRKSNEALRKSVSAGGAASHRSAIVGAWVGAAYGGSAVPAQLVSSLAPGPFGAMHLSQLASCLSGYQRARAPQVSTLDILVRRLTIWVSRAVRKITRPSIAMPRARLELAPPHRSDLRRTAVTPGEGAPTVPSLRPPARVLRQRRSSGIQACSQRRTKNVA